MNIPVLTRVPRGEVLVDDRRGVDLFLLLQLLLVPLAPGDDDWNKGKREYIFPHSFGGFLPKRFFPRNL